MFANSEYELINQKNKAGEETSDIRNQIEKEWIEVPLHFDRSLTTLVGSKSYIYKEFL